MNQAVFLALLQPGDSFMGLDLAAGGHLTHGSPVNMSGKWFKAAHYTVRREDQLIDMDAVAKQAEQVKPKTDHRRWIAYSRPWDFKRFREIADSVGAICWWTWRISPASSPAACMLRRCRTRMSRRRPRNKSLRGPRGGLILWNDEALTRKLNSAIFPGLQGGPLMHVIAAKAVAFARSATSGFQDLCKERGRERQGAGWKSAGAPWLRHRTSGGTDNHADAGGLRPAQGNVREGIGARRRSPAPWRSRPRSLHRS